MEETNRVERTHTGPGSPEDIGWALSVLLRSYRDQVGPVLGDFPHGARGYQTLLEVIRDEPPSQLVLANRLGIDRTVMTYLIDDLVESGLVERRANPVDRRQRQIVATPDGREALATLCDRVAAAERAVLGSLDPGECELFRRLLTRAACGATRPDHTADACAVITEVLHE